VARAVVIAVTSSKLDRRHGMICGYGWCWST